MRDRWDRPVQLVTALIGRNRLAWTHFPLAGRMRNLPSPLTHRPVIAPVPPWCDPVGLVHSIAGRAARARGGWFHLARGWSPASGRPEF
jgi:hypothetical protein